MKGIVNLVFTIAAMALIDRLGRRPLLGVGLAGIAGCMFLLSYGFGSATYTLAADVELPAGIERQSLSKVYDVEFGSDVEFRDAVTAAIGEVAFKENEAQLVSAAIAQPVINDRYNATSLKVIKLQYVII